MKKYMLFILMAGITFLFTACGKTQDSSNDVTEYVSQQETEQSESSTPQSDEVDIAEKNGAIVPIGNWVIEKSVQIFATWREKYDYPLVLSLNISAVQCKQDCFINNILQILKKYSVSPEEIELEITETILVEDFEETKKRLSDLRKTGIRISLDDFGTGFSSLSYLKGLPIDTLKIDKSFVDTLLTDMNTKIITESIIYMVKRLGYETVAEGVETEEQFAYLRELSCDMIQGYYTGRPMPAEAVEKLLKELTEKG